MSKWKALFTWIILINCFFLPIHFTYAADIVIDLRHQPVIRCAQLPHRFFISGVFVGAVFTMIHKPLQEKGEVGMLFCLLFN